MTIFIVRIIIFSILPLVAAGLVIGLDKTVSSKERRLEVLLIFLFALGVGGGGIANFLAHFFMADLVAASIGWSAGSPFQLEVAFANLAIGVLGIGAVGRRDGFREATVIAVTIFGVGATIVHLMDMIAIQNFAPGNTLQNILNLLKPTLLIGFLTMARRAEAEPNSGTQEMVFEQWRSAIAQAAGLFTGIVATTFGIGFAINYLVLFTLFGTALGLVVTIGVLQRAPEHQIDWRGSGSVGNP